jgi:RNA polymerase sigma-70 factor, ECF subfamily
MEDLNGSFDIALFYDLNFENLYRFFYYKTLSKDIAQDLTSETFLTFATILSKKNIEMQDPKKYLYGIAKNIFVKYLRQKYKQEIPMSTLSRDFEEYIEEFVQESISTTDYTEIIAKYIPMLPEKQGIVIKLRFVEKLTLSEICAKLGVDMNYVKTTQKRGIKSLKNLITLM